MANPTNHNSLTLRGDFFSSSALPSQKRNLNLTEQKTDSVRSGFSPSFGAFKPPVAPDFDAIDNLPTASFTACPSTPKRQKIQKPPIAGELLSKQGTQCLVYLHRDIPNKVIKVSNHNNLDNLDRAKTLYKELQKNELLQGAGIHILETEFYEDRDAGKYYLIQDQVTPFSIKENEQSADRNLLDPETFCKLIANPRLKADLRPSNLGVDDQGKIVCFDPLFPEDEEFELHQAAMLREWEAFKLLQQTERSKL